MSWLKEALEVSEKVTTVLWEMGYKKALLRAEA